YLLHLVDCVALPFASQAIDSRKEIQVLVYTEVAIQRKFLSHVAEAISRLAGRLLKVKPCNSGTTFTGPKQTAQHFKCGGFAGAVWPEKSKDFTTLNRKGHMVRSHKITEAFGQSVTLDHRSFFLGNGLQRFRHCGIAFWRATKDVDECVFKTRAHRLELRIRLHSD